MKKTFIYLYKNLAKLIAIWLVGFLLPLVTLDTISNNVSYYEATFSVENIEDIEHELLIDENFLNSIKESGENGKYDGINVEKMLQKNDFSYTINGNSITIITKSKYYENFFISSSSSVGTRAKMFIKDSVIKASNEDANIKFDNEKDIVVLKNDIKNKYLISLIISGIVLMVGIIVLLLFSKKQTKNDDKDSNEEDVFKTCLNKKYWKLATKPLKNTKDITAIAMMFAMMLVCKFIPIPSGFGNLGLSFTYLFFAIIAMIYGPIYGLIIGVFSDVIGFFVTGSSGVFHLGYTLQAALTGFIYGICLFKTKLSFSKVLFCRLLINIFINAFFGSFLYVLVFYYDDSMDAARFYELFKSYLVLLSLPKNVIYLLPQSLLLFYVIKAVCPVLNRFNLISKSSFKKQQTTTK